MGQSLLNYLCVIAPLSLSSSWLAEVTYVTSKKTPRCGLATIAESISFSVHAQQHLPEEDLCQLTCTALKRNLCHRSLWHLGCFYAIQSCLSRVLHRFQSPAPHTTS